MDFNLLSPAFVDHTKRMVPKKNGQNGNGNGNSKKNSNGNGNGNGICRIVLTGGPGAGKSTAADLLRREVGEKIVIVPEAATLLFSGGFPRVEHPEGQRAAQHAIYHVQRNLENVISRTYDHRILLCDRGTLDGAGYWPDGAFSFFDDLKTSMENELSRYDAVLFFESAALGGNSIEGGNPVRIESLSEAVALDKKLKSIWSHHPNFHIVRNEKSFFTKLQKALGILNNLIADHEAQKGS